jgi:hypothetical protein
MHFLLHDAQVTDKALGPLVLIGEYLLQKLGNSHLSFRKKGTFFALGMGPLNNFRESRALYIYI